MEANEVIQKQDSYCQAGLRQRKGVQTLVDDAHEVKTQPQQTEVRQSSALRLLIFAVFFCLGSIVMGGLASVIFGGLWVALIAIFGGACGIIMSALCQVGAAETIKECYSYLTPIPPQPSHKRGNISPQC